MDIHEAYAIYRRITCQYEDLDRIPDIFTDDVVSGNAGWGPIRGLEAQTIFLTTTTKMGLEPEEHLWCMTKGDDLAFRARNWAGAKSTSAWFDVIGHLTFDPTREKFCFYYGFFDPRTVADVLNSSATCKLEASAEGFQRAREATTRFESRCGVDADLPDRMRVSSLDAAQGVA